MPPPSHRCCSVNQQTEAITIRTTIHTQQMHSIRSCSCRTVCYVPPGIHDNQPAKQIKIITIIKVRLTPAARRNVLTLFLSIERGRGWCVFYGLRTGSYRDSHCLLWHPGTRLNLDANVDVDDTRKGRDPILRPSTRIQLISQSQRLNMYATEIYYFTPLDILIFQSNSSRRGSWNFFNNLQKAFDWVETL